MLDLGAVAKVYEKKLPQILSVTKDEDGNVIEIQIMSPIVEDHPMIITLSIKNNSVVSFEEEGYD